MRSHKILVQPEYIEIDTDDALNEIDEKEVCKFYDHSDLLEEIGIQSIAEFLEPQDFEIIFSKIRDQKGFFDSLTSYVDGGSNPRFNEAFNQWREKK